MDEGSLLQADGLELWVLKVGIWVQGSGFEGLGFRF